MEIIVKRARDAKPWWKPKGDMNDEDFVRHETERRERCADDGDFYLSKHGFRGSSVTSKRIWPHK